MIRGDGDGLSFRQMLLLAVVPVAVTAVGAIVESD